MNKLFLLVLVITALDLCSTRPAQNNGKSKKTTSSCLPGQKMPTFKIIALYDNVTLTCPFLAQSVTFLKNCKPIAVKQIASNKFTISGNSLTLTRYVTRDNGKYSCKGTDANGQTKEFTWVLHIQIKTSTTVKDIEKPVNDAVMIDCRHFVGKQLFYSHNKGLKGKTDITNNRRVLGTSTGLYELFALKIDDTGYYYCGADDDSSKLAVKLVVRELPKVSGKSLVKVGDNVLFKCEYKGPQTIAWYKDNKKLDVKSKATGKLMNKRRGKQHLNLPLTNITSDSTGIYGCGVVFDNSTFLTTIKLELLEFAKMFGTYGNVKLNSSLWVNCRSNQGDKAKYSLLKKPLLGSGSYQKVQIVSRIKDYSGGLYSISSLTLADEGYYKCRASLNGVTIEKELDRVIWFSPTL
ncbi:hemicentin-1 isoform X3 [Paramuricea clavata]|uniref:Hemicentin-1 isoform X3 n=1 Tax=Paramuricea clavata TaxID=317549 RepID=A0A6S7HZK9_PARCT|nr:hemicentin-1 isoform X3 [Paramuricea clavata]